MAIEYNGKFKLTTEFERLLVELGGADPSKTLTRDELGQALANALESLPEDSSVLRKLCNYFQSRGLFDEFMPKNGGSEKSADH